MTSPRSTLRPRQTETVFPPKDPSTIEPLTTFLATYADGALLIARDGVTTENPSQVFEVLKDVAEAMGEGRAITVAPVSLRLTTTQASEMIGVSRPTLIKLLEDGEIPYEQPRRHRLLRLDDVLALRGRAPSAQRRAARRGHEANDFPLDQLDLAEPTMLRVLAEQAAATRHPPLELEDVLISLGRAGAPGFAEAVRLTLVAQRDDHPS